MLVIISMKYVGAVMLTKVSVENFKSLKHVDVELKPLTIFIGPNGSGKSSILQSILMLKKLYRVQGSVALEGLFQLDGYINMGTWDDVTFYSTKPIKVCLEVSDNKVRMVLNTILFKDGRASLNIKLKIGNSENNLSKTITLPYSRKQPQGVTIRLKEGTLSGNWDGFNIAIMSISGKITEDIKSALTSMLNTWYQRMLFVPVTISMFRLPQASIGSQQKENIVVNIKNSLVVSDVLLMALMAMDPDTEDYVIRCEENIFGVKIRGRPLPQNVARIISSVRKGKTIPIVNEGGGINRSVYMFTILALADEGSTIMIEEPETNLHPKAQYDLAKIFIEAVTDEGKQLVITTHSEHLLLGILQQVRKKKIRLEDIAMYYVQKDKGGKTILKQLEIDEHGRVKGGLPGFFEKEVEELTELLST